MTTTLTYFDFDGSRGLECRLALAIAGVPYEDVRLSRAQWLEMKPTTPFGALPVLQIDGRTLAQTQAILGYIGRAHGLLPADGWAAAEHEAVMASVEDLRAKMPGRPDMSDEDKKTAREEFSAGWLNTWGNTVEARIRGPFLEGETPSVADIKLAVIARAFRAGAYDHIPATRLDAWPKLGTLVDAVNAHPAVTAYFASRKA